MGADFRHDSRTIDDEIQSAKGISALLEHFGSFGVIGDIVSEGEYAFGIFIGKGLEAIGSAGNGGDKAPAFSDLSGEFGTDSA